MKNLKAFSEFLLAVIGLALALVVVATCEGKAQTKRDCVIETYSSQLGVRELTGNNDGEGPKKYLASVHLSEGYAWCAAYVNWSLTQCGVKTTNSGWSPSWFTPERTLLCGAANYSGPSPQPGDVFGIYFPNKKRIAHVGFIHQWNPNHVVTYEGNTNAAGSREGDGVYKKIRMRKQIYAVSNWIDQ